jgi:hypothetical protein
MSTVRVVMAVTLDDGRVTLDCGQVVDTPDYIASDWFAHGYAVPAEQKVTATSE